MVIQMIYTPDFYIDIFGIFIESPTSGKIRMFTKNKEVIEPYKIEDAKVVRTTNYFFSIIFLINFMTDMIDTKGKVLKNSFNMKEDTNSTLA